MVSDKGSCTVWAKNSDVDKSGISVIYYTMKIHTVMKLTFTVNTPDEQPISLSQKGAHVTSVISILY